ncbi:putative histidine kinase [Paratrimastix pyriformis]|uniref:Histidine kinase n=1 Tax=Paratrimastix pyriformis TaxID=342808 RepID=A0ABQ8URH1_9EUKA|nr:putative histidine kinase [Paratrimastix pyriformis]
MHAQSTLGSDVQRAFAEAKDTFCGLVEQQQMLPQEYESCLQHFHDTVEEIQHYETQCKSLSENAAIGYITAVLVFDINHCLQNLHDIAENRVIRGSHLTEAEINFIVEITDLYNFFLLELFPSLGLNPIESLVDLTSIATEQRAPRPLSKVTINAAKRIILNGGDPNSPELAALSLSKSNLSRVSQMMRPHNEVLIRYGLVVKSRKLTKKLRYLFLTNLRLFYMENLDTFKGSIELASIIGVKASKASFQVITKGRTYMFACLQSDVCTAAAASAWERDILAAVQFFASLRQEPALPPSGSAPTAAQQAAAPRAPEHPAQPVPTVNLSPDFILPGMDLSRYAAPAQPPEPPPPPAATPPPSGLSPTRPSTTPIPIRPEGTPAPAACTVAASPSSPSSISLLASPPEGAALLATAASTPASPLTVSGQHQSPPPHGGSPSALAAPAAAPEPAQLPSFAAAPEPAPDPNQELPSYEIVVFVGRAENLLVNRKGRADNPYFFIGIGSPLHYSPRRVGRLRSQIHDGTRDPTFNETFTFRYSADMEPFLDLRLYSKTPSTVNNFSYGSVRMGLQEVFMADSHELEGWWDIGAHEGRTHGRIFIRVTLKDYPLFKVPDPVAFPVPALVTHRTFELREKVPLVFGGEHEIVATLRGDPNVAIQLVDAASRRPIYGLRKASFLKKEFLAVDGRNEEFGRCYHKLKTVRKKKIRMILRSEEFLLTMEGNYSNEVSITDFMGRPVASLVVGEGAYNRTVERVLVLTVTHPNVDAALLVLFALYVLYTL